MLFIYNPETIYKAGAPPPTENSSLYFAFHTLVVAIVVGWQEERGEVAGSSKSVNLPAQGGCLAGPGPLPPVPCMRWSTEWDVGRLAAGEAPDLRWILRWIEDALRLWSLQFTYVHQNRLQEVNSPSGCNLDLFICFWVFVVMQDL